jgi:hypothetical protein
MWVSDGATVTMVACVFTNNVIHTQSNPAAILSINEAHPGLGKQQQDTIARLQQCNFTGSNYAAYFSDADRSSKPAANPGHNLIFTDGHLRILQVFASGENRTLGFGGALSEAPTERQGITGTSPWLLRVQVRSFRASQLLTCLLVTAVKPHLMCQLSNHMLESGMHCKPLF